MYIPYDTTGSTYHQIVSFFGAMKSPEMSFYVAAVLNSMILFYATRAPLSPRFIIISHNSEMYFNKFNLRDYRLDSGRLRIRLEDWGPLIEYSVNRCTPCHYSGVAYLVLSDYLVSPMYNVLYSCSQFPVNRILNQ